MGCIFHNHRIPSTRILLHLPVPAAFQFQNTCSEDSIFFCWFQHKCKHTEQMVSQCYQGLFKEFFVATGGFGIELTRVVLDWLLGHCLTASALSHDTVSFPTGLPGPASPEAQGSRANPEAASLLSGYTWNFFTSRLFRLSMSFSLSCLC